MLIGKLRSFRKFGGWWGNINKHFPKMTKYIITLFIVFIGQSRLFSQKPEKINIDSTALPTANCCWQKPDKI